jgi:hypothetical protein
MNTLAHEIETDTTSIDMIKNITKKALLPDGQIVEKILSNSQALVGDPRYVPIILKFIRLFAVNHLVYAIRDKIADDMLYKKSTKKGKKYLPNSTDDETFTKKNLFFENKRFGGLGDIHSRIVDVLEELFIKELQKINPEINLGHICFGLMIYHNNTNTQQEIYNRDWKRELPGLSDYTTLTDEDKYLMRQISVWYEDILKFQECNLSMLPLHYHKKIDNDLEEMERIINE